eukprot:CAMPEP_0174853150 /NCGR_PEP_ID=MMETSP1114-20130205/27381_1 /TAXON_ID=312471 /ORGANISM="Neobodo designis, Strain CCAP 1951/1" /LENGTH=343 /DNA_ID=CAMNT_0016087771 /DNA_START=42 /DNA_END=1073 /DNA_ORIENTATION=+
MSARSTRVRVSAPPGVAACLQQRFPKSSASELTAVADRLASSCAANGVPLTRKLISELGKGSKASALPPLLDDALQRVPEHARRHSRLLPTRKFTIYSLVEAGAPKSVRDRAAKHTDPVAVTVGAQILSLGTRGGLSPQKITARAAAAAARFRFDLRQEAYCHRRLLTDRALLRIAEKNPGQAATYVYADSLGLTLPGRPPIEPVPHFFSAYYDFFRTHPDHFHSLDVVSELVAVVKHPAFRKFATAHHANYVEQRERWQDTRLAKDLPKNWVVPPALYARNVGGDLKSSNSLTNQALAVLHIARCKKIAIPDAVVKYAPGSITSLKQKHRYNEKLWEDFACT